MKKLTIWGMFLALCVIGANLKIMGSIAFDSFPAFLGALLLGPVAGLFLGFWGHIISALLAGLPLSLPAHLIIGAIMGIACYGYAKTFRYLQIRVNTYVSILLASCSAYIISVIINLAAMYPFLEAVVFALWGLLTIATIANLFLAGLVYINLPKYLKANLKGEFK